MRPIDADALKELIDGGFDIDFDEVPETKAALLQMIDEQPTADVAERKRGKWIEKEVMSVNESKAIDEWQSCRCSVCGRYDTRPYMYYFSNPNYCSWCGAEMKGEDE